jgi:SAM-dependent methyltransferase
MSQRRALSRVVRVARDVASGRRTMRSIWAPRLLDAVSVLSRPLATSTADDPYHRTIEWFVEEVNRVPGRRILEIGSLESPIRPRFEGFASYTGVDVRPGRSVEVVGDAHELSALVEGPFDAVVSMSTFEHLAMPWKVVLEINEVARPGALVLVTTHPAWPPHEQPWDFWRFSASAFDALLNRHTGFEVLRASEGLPGTILPLGSERSTIGIHRLPVSMGISVVARKVGEPKPSLRWDLVAADVLDTTYPLPPPADGTARS